MGQRGQAAACQPGQPIAISHTWYTLYTWYTCYEWYTWFTWFEKSQPSLSIHVTRIVQHHFSHPSDRLFWVPNQGSVVPGRVGLATLPSGGTVAPGKIGPVPPAEARTISGTTPFTIPSRGHLTLHFTLLIQTETIPDTTIYCPIRQTPKCRLSYHIKQPKPSQILSSAQGGHRNGDNLLIHPLAG